MKLQGLFLTFVVTINILIIFAIDYIQAVNDCFYDCEKIAIQTTPVPCSDVRDGIQDMKTLNQTIASHPSVCITKCHLEAFCSLAILVAQPERTCLLMSKFYGEKTTVPYTLDDPKCKAFLLDSARCKNCGTPDIVSCSCLGDYYGRFCEFNKPPHCNSGKWKVVALSYPQQKTRAVTWHHPLKLEFTMDDVNQAIHTSERFYAEGSYYSSTSEPVMKVDFDTADFEKPLSIEFMLTSQHNAYITQKMLLNGSNNGDVITKPYYNRHFEFLKDNDPVVRYNANPRDIINGLGQGHRLMSRGPVQVRFDPRSNSTAYIMRALNLPEHTTSQFVEPIEMSALKQTLHTGEKFEALYRFGQGIHETRGSNESRIWEMDDCWYSPQTARNESDRILMIRDATLRGQEIRVLIGDTISADVLQVTVTPFDIVVELTPSFTPISGTDPFQLDSRIIHKAISMSKIESICEREMGKADVFLLETNQYSYNVEWFIGSAQVWKLIFQNHRNGSQLSLLSLNELMSHVQAYRDIRVCVEYSQMETLCLSPNHLIVNDKNIRILFHSRPFMKLGFDTEGKFDGFSYMDCRLTQYLISSHGLIRAISYTIGNNATGYESVVEFNSISWFVRTPLPTE